MQPRKQPTLRLKFQAAPRVFFTFSGGNILINSHHKKCIASGRSPDLCKLMDLKLGNSLARESSDSSMVVRLLLARMSVSRDGNIIPNFRISVQS